MLSAPLILDRRVVSFYDGFSSGYFDYAMMRFADFDAPPPVIGDDAREFRVSAIVLSLLTLFIAGPGWPRGASIFSPRRHERLYKSAIFSILTSISRDAAGHRQRERLSIFSIFGRADTSRQAGAPHGADDARCSDKPFKDACGRVTFRRLLSSYIHASSAIVSFSYSPDAARSISNGQPAYTSITAKEKVYHMGLDTAYT